MWVAHECRKILRLLAQRLLPPATVPVGTDRPVFAIRDAALSSASFQASSRSPAPKSAPVLDFRASSLPGLAPRSDDARSRSARHSPVVRRNCWHDFVEVVDHDRDRLTLAGVEAERRCDPGE